MVVALGSLCYADPQPNLVVNGGFETGDFSGWTVSGNITPCLFVGTAGYAGCIPTTSLGGHSGTYAAELGNAGGDATLSEVLNTTGDGTFDITFWLASQSYGTPVNDFSVSWGGTTLMSAVNLPAFGYTEYEFAGLTAAGPTTVLTFEFRNDPSYFVLDDVSVVDPPRMPEPAGAGGIGVLLAILMMERRRRGRAVIHKRVSLPENC